MAHVNDDPQTWAQMWRAELAAGMVPYYMFVARDTGPRSYFEVPLDRAGGIFTTAYQPAGPGPDRARPGHVRHPGKVVVDHAAHQPDSDTVLRLRFLQARDPRLVGRLFKAWMGPGAAWLDDVDMLPANPTTSGPPWPALQAASDAGAAAG